MKKMKSVSSFNSRLKELMNYYNIRQIDIVEKTGLSKPLISRYVNNNYNAKMNNVKKIADAFNVDPLWLMGFDVDMTKKESLKERIIDRIEKLNNEDLEKIDKVLDILES